MSCRTSRDATTRRAHLGGRPVQGRKEVHQRIVVAPDETAFELEYAVPSGGRSRDSQRVERGLRPRGAELDDLRAR